MVILAAFVMCPDVGMFDGTGSGVDWKAWPRNCLLERGVPNGRPLL